jgi:hypothetical protein
MDYYDRTKELEEILSIDNSESYEVDYAGVYWDPKTSKIAYITASGCSCWDGDYAEEQFGSIEALRRSLLHDEKQYNPSLSTATQLIDATIEWLNNRKPIDKELDDLLGQLTDDQLFEVVTKAGIVG